MSKAELEREITAARPINTLPLLPFVKKLTLRLSDDADRTWDTNLITSRSWLINITAGLTVLRFNDVTFSAMQGLMELVASASELQELYMPDCGIRERWSGDSNVFALHKAPKLHTVKLTAFRSSSGNSMIAGAILRWIEFHHHLHILHRVFITGDRSYEVDTSRLSKVLEIAGSGVENLTIGFGLVLSQRTSSALYCSDLNLTISTLL